MSGEKVTCLGCRAKSHHPADDACEGCPCFNDGFRGGVLCRRFDTGWMCDPDCTDPAHDEFASAPVTSEVTETTAGERPRCDTCSDAGRTPWVIEGDPNCYVEPDSEGMVPCPDCTPAETTAGEREVEALADALYRARQSRTTPDTVPEWLDARAVLASDWLAALLDRVRREEGERVLREAADAIVLPGSESSGFYAGEVDAGYREAERHAEDWLTARAASVGRGEGL